MSISNYNRSITRNISGNLYLFLADASNVLDVTVASGEVTDIVMASATYFHGIDAEPNSVKRRQTGSRTNRTHTYYLHNIDFKCSKASLALNALIEALDNAQPSGVIAIIVDSNLQGWLIGWSIAEEQDRPLYLQENLFDSGEIPTEIDQSHHAFNLNGTNDQRDLPLNNTLNDYIQACLLAGTDVGFTP